MFKRKTASDLRLSISGLFFFSKGKQEIVLCCCPNLQFRLTVCKIKHFFERLPKLPSYRALQVLSLSCVVAVTVEGRVQDCSKA